MSNKSKIIKILIVGSAGQGVLWLGRKIAEEILNKNPKKFVSAVDEYEAGVRSGESRAQVIVSDKQISCPFVDKPDYFIDLRKNQIEIGESNEMIELEGEGRINEQALKEILNKIFN